MIELRHLRAFVVVADELNFTRAASRLHLGQQTLSAQISQLEARLGVRLFERSTRRVTLTPAGTALHERIPGLLNALQDSLDAARQADRGEIGQLRVGLAATGTLELTARILRRFAELRPRVGVSVLSFDFREPSGGLRSDETDVALAWLPFHDEGLDHEVLYEDPRVAVLPAGHRLAKRKQLKVADLLDEPFGWIEDLDCLAREFWTLTVHRGGRPPRIGVRITGFDDYYAAVRAGQVIAVSPSTMVENLPDRNIVLRPVVDLEPAQLATCWRAGKRNALVDAFVRAAQVAVAPEP
jgi:DNA-binding transcriptional LysR family regulator